MGGQQITVTFKNSDQKNIAPKTTLASLCTLNDDVVAAYVNGTLCHLDQKIETTSFVEWVKSNDEAGARVYQRSLCLLLFTALQELFPSTQVELMYSSSSSFYIEPLKGTIEFTSSDLKIIGQKINSYISNNLPIKQVEFSKSSAINLFENMDQYDTANLLKQLPQNQITLYSCNDVVHFLYEPPSNFAGKIDQFEIISESKGVLLRFPELIDGQIKIPPYQREDKLIEAFIEEEKWANSVKCPFISDLNKMIIEGTFSTLVEKSETKHSEKIKEIAEFLSKCSKNRRVICIAGPSSSGKTTFAGRLQKELKKLGFSPLLISIDDYFKDREDSPKNPDGTYDFETIEALELDLFNRDLQALLDGKLIDVPTFNFLDGKKEYLGEQLQLEKNGFIILEGIHGLNDRLTYEIPRENKIKIYMSALTQLALDNHNRISTSDSRLIRRIVRDYQFRGASAERTFGMWQSVREGEKKYIFPFQNDSDILFNSATIYELAILKKWIVPLLKKIPHDSEYNSDAQRILNFLSYFVEGAHEVVPEESILREFIGLEEFKL